MKTPLQSEQILFAIFIKGKVDAGWFYLCTKGTVIVFATLDACAAVYNQDDTSYQKVYEYPFYFVSNLFETEGGVSKS